MSWLCLLGPLYGAIAVPLCHASSLSLSWTSMRRRRATVATPGEWACGVSVANGSNIFQMLPVFTVVHLFTYNRLFLRCLVAVWQPFIKLMIDRLLDWALQTVAYCYRWPTVQRGLSVSDRLSVCLYVCVYNKSTKHRTSEIWSW